MTESESLLYGKFIGWQIRECNAETDICFRQGYIKGFKFDESTQKFSLSWEVSFGNDKKPIRIMRNPIGFITLERDKLKEQIFQNGIVRIESTLHSGNYFEFIPKGHTLSLSNTDLSQINNSGQY